MTNEEFQVELRRETKTAKRKVLQTKSNTMPFRYWNNYKVQLVGLQSFIKNHSEISESEIKRLIACNPTSLKFLNQCIETVPTMINDLKQHDYLFVFEKFYKTRRQLLTTSQSQQNVTTNY